jgi:hypothetical protein
MVPVKGNTEGQWQRAQMLAEEASGEGLRKRQQYTQAIDEQNELAHKRAMAERFAKMPHEQRAPYAADEYRDASSTPGRYDGETLRRRTG